uniref:APK peptide n=1 Tax=Delia radicum TaxID=30064 RepID=NPLP1_DELRA|nr:RecName: Full=APK peptide [Delia radicum]
SVAALAAQGLLYNAPK